jgi:hypothetical protein
MRLYIDGVESAAPVADISTESLRNRDDIWLARSRGGGRFWHDHGDLADVSLHSRALSSAEIHTLFTSGRLPN